MKGLSGRKKVEFEKMVTLAREGKLNQWPKEVIRQWCKARLGVDVSDRHLRRVVNQTRT